MTGVLNKGEIWIQGYRQREEKAKRHAKMTAVYKPRREAWTRLCLKANPVHTLILNFQPSES